MPVYSTQCRDCLVCSSVFRKIADRDNLPECGCGGKVDRILDRPFIRPEITPYYSPTDGRQINSRVQRSEDLARSGAYEWEPGIEAEIARKREAAIADSFKPISDAVDETVRNLNTSGKLENLNA